MSLALAFALLLAAPAQAAVVCVSPNNPNCFATVQAGVDDAVSGDVVQVAPGFYLENVTIGTARITLRGGKGAIIHPPSGPGGPPIGITVTAADVTIEGVSINSPSFGPGIRLVDAANTYLTGVKIRSQGGSVCIEMTGATPGVVIEGSRLIGGLAVKSEDSDGLQLLSNTIRYGSGTNLNGDGIVAEGNRFLLTSGTALLVNGADPNLTDNHFELCNLGVDVNSPDGNLTGNHFEVCNRGVDANGTSVIGNTFRNIYEFAIIVESDSPVIENNTVTSAGVGIDVFCTRACQNGRIVRNRLSRLRHSGIHADQRTTLQSRLQIEANQITQVGGDGIHLEETRGVTVVRNRVTGTGGSCIALSDDASDNTLSDNTLTDCFGDGIHVVGDGNTVEGNRISGTSDDGIEVSRTEFGGRGNAVLDNLVTGAIDNGITIRGIATTVSGNRTQGLHANYCDGGSGTVGTDVPDATVCH